MEMPRLHLAAIGTLLFAVVALTGRVGGHRVQPKAEAEDARFVTSSVVLRDGAILACYQKSGRGPTLVLVPETHGDRAQFFEKSFLDHLPPDLPLLIIESRGQGRSWPPPTPGQATIERYASDVLEVVRALNSGEWIIGGHSLGGMIALEVAGRHPAGLRGVIALEGWAHHRVQRLAFPVAQVRTEAEKAEARQQRTERYRSQRWTEEEAAGLTKAWTSWERGEQILKEIRYPVLSVWGDRGLASRPSRADLLLPDNPAIELRWIAGSDHYITDAPFCSEVAVAISSFIQKNGLNHAAGS